MIMHVRPLGLCVAGAVIVASITGIVWVLEAVGKRHAQPLAASGSSAAHEGISLTPRNRSDLASIAGRMGVTPDMALEIAVNRLAVSVMKLREGDPANVDFDQSIKTAESGPDATSASLPGFGRA